MLEAEKLIKVNDVYFGFLKKIITPLFLMSVFRVLLFFINRANLDNYSFVSILDILLMGLRFDLLIWGFVLIIPTLLLPLIYLFNVGYTKALKTLFDAYFIICWLVIVIISFGDFIQYSISGHRISWADLMHFSLFQVQLFNMKLGFFTLSMICLTFLVSFIIGVRDLLKSDEVFFVSHNLKKTPKILLILLPILLTLLMARGTLRPHHLRYEDSLITDNSRLNELALTPAWTFTK